MATIYPHPAMLHKPQQIEAFQRRYGLLIVLGNTGPIAIPALHLRTPRTTATQPANYGGDAA